MTAPAASSGPQPLEEMFQPGAASAASYVDSSISEPRPGEPLSAEAEAQLADLPDPAGQESAPGEMAAETLAPVPALSNRFKEEYVADVLEEIFAWLADRFESEHWLLSDRQSRMLSEPSTLLLGSLWQHLQRMLPAILERWAESTPGLMDAVFAFGIVLTPKCIKQFELSRQRKAEGRPAKSAGPQPVPARPPYAGGPIGPITGTADPLPAVEVS